MNSDMGALIFLIVLWSGFIVGCFMVIKDKRQDNKWALDKSGRR